MTADGSDVVRLTHDDWISTHPAWSPTGLIAYAQSGRGPRGYPDHRIRVMDNDGSNDHPTLRGEWIVADHVRWATMAPFVVVSGQNPDTSASMTLEGFVGARHSALGSGVVKYVGEADGLPPGEPVGRPFTSVVAPVALNKRHSPEDFPHSSDIWLREWIGRDEIRVTHLTDNDAAFDADPALSPTGDLIVFQRNDDNGSTIMTVRPDGSDVRHVAVGVRPRWSPDGTQILYSRFAESCEGSYCGYEMVVVNADGSDPHVVGLGDQPEWGPACTITGTEGDDTIVGTDARDFICAGEGDDTVSGGGGNDTVFGGRGDDMLMGEAGDDVLMGERGDDRLFGGAGRDAIGNADRFDGDATFGGPDVDICYLDPSNRPTRCEVVRTISWK